MFRRHLKLRTTLLVSRENDEEWILTAILRTEPPLYSEETRITRRGLRGIGETMTIIDMDEYRRLLLEIGVLEAPYLRRLDEETLTFYTRWMRNDNLIVGEIVRGFGGNRRSLLQLTENGEQYAELLRDSTRWGYVKAMMRRHHLPFEIEEVKRLVAEFDER